MTESPRPPWDDPTGTPQPDPMNAPPPPQKPDPTGPIPPPQQAATPFATQDDKVFALVAHFGGAAASLVTLGILGFVPPLIAYLARGQQSQTVRAHAVAALNFQALWSLVAFLVFFPGMCLGFIPSLLIMGVQIAFGVTAGIKASESQLFTYPMAPTFIR